MPAPSNDNFASATSLTGTSGSIAGTTLDATNESEPTIGTVNAQSVWYKITPSTSGQWNFTIPRSEVTYVGDQTAASMSLRFSIFNETVDTIAECTRANELPIGFVEDSISQFSGDVNGNVTLFSGNTYYIKIASNANSAVSNDSVCSFNLYWELMTGPSNDNLANATSFGSPPDSITGETNKLSCSEIGENAHWGLGLDQSVWYEFTPSSTGMYRFALTNMSQNSLTTQWRSALELFSGSSFPLTKLSEADAFTNPTGLACRSVLTSGTSYKIKVASPNYDYNDYRTFNFDIDVSHITSPGIPPANDDIANAQDLGTDPGGITSGSNIDATVEAWESSNNYDQPSVWYKFTITGSDTQRVTITKTGTDPDWQPYAEIYTVINNPPSDFTDLNYFNLVGDTFQSPTTAYTDITWTPGDYYMFVGNWNWDGSWDDFEINFFVPPTPPVNDNFSSRTNLPDTYKVCVTGTTTGATTEGSEPNTNPGSINPPHPSVWYEWTAPNYNNTPLNFQFDTIGSDAGTDTYLELFTGSSFFSPLTLVQSDHNSGAGGKSLITQSVASGTNYKIRVSSPSASEGNFKLNISALPGGSPPANDNFANAELLTGFSDSSSGTTIGATAECDEPVLGSNQEKTNTVWYKYIPSITGRLRLSLDTASTDGMACAIARTTTGGGLSSLVEIDSADIQTFGGEEYSYFSVEAGYDYYFIVSGLGGESNTFTIKVDMANVSTPTNDNTSGATTITVTPTVVGNLSPKTEGANFDSIAVPSEIAGNYTTRAYADITVWYKFTVAEAGNVTFTLNSDTTFNGDFTDDTSISVYKSSGTDVPSSFVKIFGNTGVYNIEAGTYYVRISSYTWTTAASVDYIFVLQDENVGGLSPSPSNGTSDFSSTTGTFLADNVDDVFVASGGVGYGTINTWSEGHYPYGYWVRFYIDSTSGDYLYRYGQSEDLIDDQFGATVQGIEVFRATRESGDYDSLWVVGYKNGEQIFAVARNGHTNFEVVNSTLTGYIPVRVFGAKKEGSSTKTRIELGENGITIDGVNYYDARRIFGDDQSDQIVSFRFGMINYPADGTSYVDLDPEWNFRFSDIKIHDNPQTNIMGPTDTTVSEITLLHGWTSGETLYQSGNPSFRVVSTLNAPVVITSPGDYDGYSLDCSENSTTGDNINACAVQWAHDGTTGDHEYTDPPSDGYFAGMSWRFYVTSYPSANLVIALMGDTNNGQFLVLGTDGTLYIKPSVSSDLIPFCTVNLNTYYYIELQGDTSTRTYAVKIWFNNVYMGRFETTTVPNNFTLVPNRPPMWKIYRIGKLGPATNVTSTFAAITVGYQIRDVALTRCKTHRPIGPTIVIDEPLNSVGTHSFPNPDTISPGVSDLAMNSDFSGATDTPGQPLPWTGYDRHDSGVPSGATQGGFLFTTWGDSTITVGSEGSGPPGLTGANAMIITAANSGAEAAYVFDDGAGNYGSGVMNLDYSDTLSLELWIKGPAGQRILTNAKTNIGDLGGFNTHYMTGGWDKVHVYLEPNPGSTLFLRAVLLSFPDSITSDVFYVKDFHMYINSENNPRRFYQTTDGGTTVTEILPGDTSSWDNINDLPASGSDQIYINTEVLTTKVRGHEDDGKTHLPPQFVDDYLEYSFGDFTEDKELLGIKLIVAAKGYTGLTAGGIIDYDTFTDGKIHINIANSDGDYRFIAVPSASSSGENLGINLPVPAGLGEWTRDKWNNFLVRFGFHDDYATSSFEIQGNPGAGAVIMGVKAEALVYDRRLFPPPCAQPIDLSRIRFRAEENNEID